jgi:hypothetical protein
MKSIQCILPFTLIFFSMLFFTFSPASGRGLSSDTTITKMEEIKKEAGKSVEFAHIQLQGVVQSSSIQQIKIAAKILEIAMMNVAVAGELFTKIQNGNTVNVEHTETCLDIAYELKIATGYLATGKIRKTNTRIARVKKLAKNQPQPTNIEQVHSEFDKIKREVATAAGSEKEHDSFLSKSDIARDAMGLK